MRKVVLPALVLIFFCSVLSSGETTIVDRRHVSASDTHPGTLDLPFTQSTKTMAFLLNILYIQINAIHPSL